jgi:hypothetical protein
MTSKEVPGIAHSRPRVDLVQREDDLAADFEGIKFTETLVETASEVRSRRAWRMG